MTATATRPRLPKSDEDAARQIIDALLAAGYVLDHVDDGGDEVKVRTTDDAWEAIDAVEDATLYVKTGRDAVALLHVRFVLGNSPDEVVCDHAVRLSPVIDPVCHKWWGWN